MQGYLIVRALFISGAMNNYGTALQTERARRAKSAKAPEVSARSGRREVVAGKMTNRSEMSARIVH